MSVKSPGRVVSEVELWEGCVLPARARARGRRSIAESRKLGQVRSDGNGGGGGNGGGKRGVLVKKCMLSEYFDKKCCTTRS